MLDTVARLSDAVAWTPFTQSALRFSKCFEGHVGTAIANGVEAQLEAGFCSLGRHLIELRLIPLCETFVSRIVRERFTHRGCTRAQRAVHVSLEHAGVEHGIA